MDFIKKGNYSVGDVVYAQNLNMKYDYRLPESESNCKIAKHFFVVIYSEAQDPLTVHKKNYVVAKLTSR